MYIQQYSKSKIDRWTQDNEESSKSFFQSLGRLDGLPLFAFVGNNNNNQKKLQHCQNYFHP
jgi:hypothetical protein